MIITDIEEKSKNRSAVSVDGVIKAWINNDILAEHGYHVGDCISEEELENLIAENNKQKTKDRALNILSYRDHSRSELERKLNTKGCNDEDAREVLDRLCELGFIDDEIFAVRYYNELVNTRLFSVRRARAELIKKGIDRELIENAVLTVNADDVSTMLSLFERRLRSKITDIEKRNTLAQSLMRNGFLWSDIQSAFLRYDEENIDE